MILTVLEHPNERLYMQSEEVKDFNQEIRNLVSDMLQTMNKKEGIGLAAPQVDVHKRIFVLNVPDLDEEHKIIDFSKPEYLHCSLGDLIFINPKIVSLSSEMIELSEGCLSIPGKRAEVKRPRFIEVEYYDENGKQKTLKAQGWLARCIQHENDHLDGVLYIRHLSPLKQALMG